jgi:hypothetical protein
MQSVHITTKFVRSNLVYEGVLNTTLCDIKFVSDLHQVGGFLLVFRFPPQIKLNATI